VRVLSWASILYGAALSAAAAGAALAGLARRATSPAGRQAAVITAGMLATDAGPIAWNAILRATHASQFFTDAPVAVLPASWQDTGSGVFALATTAVLLGGRPLAGVPGAAARRGSVACARMTAGLAPD
jgi:hypothetical protein